MRPERFPEKETEKDVERARGEIGAIFSAFDEGQKRVDAIISKVELFFLSGLIDGDRVRQSLRECSAIKGKDEFIEKTLAALWPLIELRKNNPKAFEEIERKAFVPSDQERINEVLSYGIDKDIIHIHLAPAKQLGIGKLIKLVREGLVELAKIIEKNKDVKNITATSWMVAKNPKFVENFGFTVEGEIDEETRREHFAGDERKINSAVMSRKEFLDKYLRKK